MSQVTQPLSSSDPQKGPVKFMAGDEEIEPLGPKYLTW